MEKRLTIPAVLMLILLIGCSRAKKPEDDSLVKAVVSTDQAKKDSDQQQIRTNEKTDPKVKELNNIEDFKNVCYANEELLQLESEISHHCENATSEKESGLEDRDFSQEDTKSIATWVTTPKAENGLGITDEDQRDLIVKLLQRILIKSKTQHLEKIKHPFLITSQMPEIESDFERIEITSALSKGSKENQKIFLDHFQKLKSESEADWHDEEYHEALVESFKAANIEAPHFLGASKESSSEEKEKMDKRDEKELFSYFDYANNRRRDTKSPGLQLSVKNSCCFAHIMAERGNDEFEKFKKDFKERKDKNLAHQVAVAKSFKKFKIKGFSELPSVEADTDSDKEDTSK